ncbi:daptide biosynthesis RiPP recognition protein [Streptomyces misionensis]|uniref:daptide biosynthesis RiPP recognition protein n=1 Tax=Streptomyces misionensis TaxID=67331 RepID=UPI0036C1AEEB
MNEALISRTGRHLRSWATGRPLAGGTAGGGSATVVLEDAAQLPAVLASDVVGPRTLVLVPGDQDGEEHGPSGATVVGFEGSLSEPGGDASIGGAIFLQVQDYGTSPYMSLLGTTLVRVAGEPDFEAFLADADRARETGEFEAFAVSPAVQIADLGALGEAAPDDGPGTRLWVAADGAVSVSPQGTRLGTAGDGAADLSAAWTAATAAAPSVALGRAVPEAVRGPAVAERPWLGRYLAALDMLRDLQVHGVSDVRISGFGGRLAAELADVSGAYDAQDPAVPFLAWTPQAAYVRVPGHERTFRLGGRAARTAERLLVHGDPATAADGADGAAVRQVLDFFAERGAPLLPAMADAPAEVGV